MILNKYKQALETIDQGQIDTAVSLIESRPGKILFLGNGGSMAIASHLAEDFTKNYRPAICPSDPSLLSCFANDYGWPMAYYEWLKRFYDKERDVLIAISSSGESENILNACIYAKPHITLTGFYGRNRLLMKGGLNFYVPFHDYGPVECTHQAILHTILDTLIASKAISRGFQAGEAYRQAVLKYKGFSDAAKILQETSNSAKKMFNELGVCMEDYRTCWVNGKVTLLNSLVQEGVSDNPARVLVIGANSFAAKWFVKNLMDNNLMDENYRLMEVSRSFLHPAGFRPYVPHYFCRLDLNDLTSVDIASIKDFNPHYIVNFAAQSEVQQSWDSPQDWFQTNTVGLCNLIQLMEKLPDLKKYVHISTPEVYGTCEGLIKPDHPMAPTTPYAASKASADMLLQAYCKTKDFPVVFVRSSNYYGSYQQLHKLIPKTIIKLKKGEKIQLNGGGLNELAWIHGADNAEAVRLVMEEGDVGQVYHVAPDTKLSVSDTVRLICDEMAVIFRDSAEVTPARDGQTTPSSMDCGLIKALGWGQRIPLMDGLRETIAWIHSNWDTIKDMPTECQHKK